MMLKCLAIIWTLPNTLLGVGLGLLGMLLGGRARWVGGALEFHGTALRWLFGKLPNGVRAMTLGHSILGVDESSLERARDHEHVHVRQYERWGPLFIPAYLGCSLLLLLRGQDPYHDNPFEKQAYAIAIPDFDNGADRASHAVTGLEGLGEQGLGEQGLGEQVLGSEDSSEENSLGGTKARKEAGRQKDRKLGRSEYKKRSEG